MAGGEVEAELRTAVVAAQRYGGNSATAQLPVDSGCSRAAERLDQLGRKKPAGAGDAVLRQANTEVSNALLEPGAQAIANRVVALEGMPGRAEGRGGGRAAMDTGVTLTFEPAHQLVAAG